MKKLYELDPSKEFDDEFGSATSDSSITPDGITAGSFDTVSGVGIEDDSANDEEVENNIQEMLAKLNARTDEEMSSDLEKQEAERERYRQEEEEKLREAKERFNRERYEKEQEALRKKREEEAAAALEEEEEKPKTNPFSFLSGFGKKKESLGEFESDYVEEDEKPKKEKISWFKKKKADKLEELELVENTKPSKEESKEKQEEPVQQVVSTRQKDEEFINSNEFAPEPEDVELELKSKEVRPSIEDEFDFEGMMDEEIPEGMEELVDKEEDPSYAEQVREAEEREVEKVEVSKPTKEETSKPIKKKKESKPSPFASFVSSLKGKPAAKPSKSKNEPAMSSDGEPDWKYIATHDEMTGLLNSRAYYEDLKEMSPRFGVIFFDINNLKYVNDNFSHESGNRLIKGVCEEIKSRFGENHLYRIGGDEFVCFIPSPKKNEGDRIAEISTEIHNALVNRTKADPEKIVYAVSIGYAFGDGKATKEEVIKAADAAMYQNKKAYKLSHPNLDVRKEFQQDMPKEKEKKPAPEHDELLTKEQKQLKTKIKEEHEKVSKGSTQTIMREIQKRASEIEAIFIASPTFDHLFVITDIDDFLDIMEQQQALIDYSYLYIVYAGGPQYYGADEYYKEVTHLFEEVSDALMNGKFRSEKDIQSIPGINIFKNIYV